jgi:hypothetical protein
MKFCIEFSYPVNGQVKMIIIAITCSQDRKISDTAKPFLEHNMTIEAFDLGVTLFCSIATSQVQKQSANTPPRLSHPPTHRIYFSLSRLSFHPLWKHYVAWFNVQLQNESAT